MVSRLQGQEGVERGFMMSVCVRVCVCAHVCVCVCVPAGPPHSSEGYVTMSTMRACKGNKRSERAFVWAELLNLQRSKCHDFCPDDQFHPISSEESGGSCSSWRSFLFSLFSFHMIQSHLTYRTDEKGEMTWKQQLMMNMMLNQQVQI